MARPKKYLKLSGLLTASDVSAELGMSVSTLRRCLREGILPPPSRVEDGVRYFSAGWLDLARVALKAKAEEGQ